MTELQSRFAFPYPTDTCAQLRKAIVWLLLDGKPRSVLEIKRELGTEKEIGARIREARRPEFGGWPIIDARSNGPDEDGVYRYRMDVSRLPQSKGAA